MLTRTDQLISAVKQSGFAYLDSLIHLFVGGSELHGAKVKNTDDLDTYGVYLEPPELVLGLDKQDFYVWSTAGDERRKRREIQPLFTSCSPRTLRQSRSRGRTS